MCKQQKVVLIHYSFGIEAVLVLRKYTKLRSKFPSKIHINASKSHPGLSTPVAWGYTRSIPRRWHPLDTVTWKFTGHGWYQRSPLISCTTKTFNTNPLACFRCLQPQTTHTLPSGPFPPSPLSWRMPGLAAGMARPQGHLQFSGWGLDLDLLPLLRKPLRVECGTAEIVFLSWKFKACYRGL